jgi:hypothetical protein
MKTEKKETLTNDKLNMQVEEIADLPVADEQADQAKGGPTINFTKIEFTYQPYDDQHKA